VFTIFWEASVKEKAHNNINNSSHQSQSETSYNNYYFPYDWSQPSNNNNFSDAWSQTDSRNSDTASIPWSLPSNKYTVTLKRTVTQSTQRRNTSTQNNTNRTHTRTNYQSDNWTRIDTEQIVKLNTIAWKLGMKISPKYGSRNVEDPRAYGLTKEFYDPNFL
jgi:hypothetical protein